MARPIDRVVMPDPETLAAEVARALLGRLSSAQADGETPHVVLTGGTIAQRVHYSIGVLAASRACPPIDWSRVEFWWGDERFVPADSADRNARSARQGFLDLLPIPNKHIHEIAASDQVSSVEEAAERYGELLRDRGADAFEIVMLGMGPDGHIASLFPGHPALDVHDQLTIAVTDSPKPPPERVTMSFASLRHTRSAWFLVSGEEKGAAMRAALSEGDWHEIPARGVSGEVATTWWCDDDADRAL